MASWSFVKLDILPKVFVSFSILSLLAVLVTAILHGDVSIYVPYISEAGSTPPASIIFSTYLNIMAFLGSALIILRYMIVEDVSKALHKPLHKVNKIALFTGLLSMLGGILTSAAPVTKAFTAHMIGASVLFVSLVIYGFLQILITYTLYPEYSSAFILKTRLSLVALNAINCVIMVVTAAVGFRLFGPFTEGYYAGKKTPEDQGFIYLLISSLAEWIIVLLSFIVILTFIPELKEVTLHVNLEYSNPVLNASSCDNNISMKRNLT